MGKKALDGMTGRQMADGMGHLEVGGPAVLPLCAVNFCP
jgi:hypothetical protein